MNDDYGAQESLQISPDMYREMFKPRQGDSGKNTHTHTASHKLISHQQIRMPIHSGLCIHTGQTQAHWFRVSMS